MTVQQAIQTAAGEEVRVVGGIDELVAFAAAHPRALAVLREPAPTPLDRLLRHALRLGRILEAPGFGAWRAVRHDPDARDSTALSLAALPFHTDGSFLERPPSRFLMSCLRDDEGGGGISTFYPVDDLVAVLPGWVADALYGAEYWFPQTYDGDPAACASVAPILSDDQERRPCIRWRSDAHFRPPVVHARATRAAEAVDWLHDHLSAARPIRVAARPGDTLLVPNQAMVHGRTGLTPGSRRELLRVWIA